MMTGDQKLRVSGLQNGSRVMGRKASMLSIASAALSGLALANPSYALNYQLTNTITASTLSPYITTDNTGQNVNYSNISLLTNPNPSIPNGQNYTSLVGVMGGNFNANGTVLSNGVTTSDKGQTAYNAFLYNSNGFQLVGRYTTNFAGSYAQTSVKAVNSLGQVLGGQSRSAANSTSTGVLGQEVWLSSPASPTTSSSIYLGLFGTNNTYTKSYVDADGFSSDTGTYSSQSGSSLSNAISPSTTGYAVGTSGRFAGDGNAAIGSVITGSTLVANSTSLGQSAWIETSAGVPTEIGLTGAGNSYAFNASSNTVNVGKFYSNSTSGVNANGLAFGTSSAFTNAGATPSTSLGQDGFLYNAASATPNTPVGMYYSGQTVTVAAYGVGSPTTYNFYYSPTANVGTTPVTSQGRSTSVRSISSNGTVTGTSSYYTTTATTSTNNGQVAFAYDGTNYTRLGYTANNFPSSAYPLPVGVTSFVNGGSQVGVMSSNTIAINASGTIAGTSTTYVGQGTNAAGGNNNFTNNGSAAWSSTPTGVLTQIGLWNQGPTATVAQAAGTANAGYSATYNIHQNPAQYGPYSDTPSLMNNNGLIAGSSQRYNSSGGSSLGADAWVFDPNAGPNGTTYPVDPISANGTGYAFENIAYLSDTGILVGEFRNSSTGNFTAFIWNDAAPTTSFTLLNGVNVSGMSAAGFQSLIEGFYGSDPTAGPIYVVGSTGASASNTITGLGTVVPEPATLSLLGLGALGLLGRRRKA